MEIDIDDDLHWDRMTLVHRWLELVLPDCFHRFFIETHAEVTHHPDIYRIALGIDDQLDGDNALILVLASLIGKLRLYAMDHAGSRDAATHAHYAAAVTANAARSNSGSMTGSNAASLGLTKAAARATALGNQSDLRRLGITQQGQLVRHRKLDLRRHDHRGRRCEPRMIDFQNLNRSDLHFGNRWEMALVGFD